VALKEREREAINWSESERRQRIEKEMKTLYLSFLEGRGGAKPLKEKVLIIM